MIDYFSITPDVYDSENYVTVDFETDTSHGDYGHPVHKDNGLVLACWTPGPDHPWSRIWGDTPKSCWGGEFDMEELLEDIEQADYIVAHSSKYELGWLRRCGLDLAKVLVFDTKIAEYVLFGNRAAGDKVMPPVSTSLDACCKRRGWPGKDPVVDVMIKNGNNPVAIPRPWLGGRCYYDVRMTEKLFRHQRDSLRKSDRLPVQLTRCIITPMLADMEFEGMALDQERVEKAHAEHTQELTEINLQLEEFSEGMNWDSDQQLAEFLYNPPKPQPMLDEEGSEVWEMHLEHKRRPGVLTKQVKRISRAEADALLSSPDYIEGQVGQLFTRPGLGFQELRKRSGEPQRTDSGQKKTDSDTIGALTARTKKQERFLGLYLRRTKLIAALSKNLDFFKGICDEYGGVFHAVFNQTSTATNRLSSSGIPTEFKTVLDSKGNPATKSVQFQNLPNAFKPVFKARKRGWVIAESDGSQLEFRVAAQLSRDRQMVEDILNPDFDAHITSASEMHGVSYDELYDRYKAGDKEAYEIRRLAKPDTFGPLYGKQFGTEAQVRWIEAFRKRYEGFYRFSERNVHTVLSEKRLVTPWGLRYYWPYASISSGGYINVSTNVYNYPVQAFATAEIIPIAIRAFWDRIQLEGATSVIRPINTVHDSLLCEVKSSAIDVWREIALEAFTTDVYAYLSRVYGYEFDLVPLGVGLCWGTHWADDSNQEQEWNVFQDGTRVNKAA